MKKQAFNPYLPSWEYIPDGEPYVFGDRVYIYGSHDLFNGWVFCLGDYICYSAPVDDLSDWRYEGVIYPKTSDPFNKDGSMCLYAPDVTVGPDGRYYLYYVLDKVNVVSVAVCDTPAGKYEFYGYVHYADGTLLGNRAGDEPQFDPGVITENGKTYMYTGFCGRGDKSRHGSMCTTLDEDMLTIIEEPIFVVPGIEYAQGTSFEGHSFFEASSIRKIGDTYYFVYSSAYMTELCYATSKNPRGDFKYGGCIIANCDLHIDTYKDAELRTNVTGNNHGSIVEINGEWYVFYHRQTNGTWFSRQDCAEKINILPDGSIPQVEITSCGLNGGPLEGKGYYPAYIACNVFNREGGHPKITQDGCDGSEIEGHIAEIKNGSIIGFKYFDFKDTKEISIWTRGYCHGRFLIRTSIDGEVLGDIPVNGTNIWVERKTEVAIPNGVGSLYFEFEGGQGPHFKGFEIK